MRRNQKGFTLIELLAVIVILAIIALIATPMVLKYIEGAREDAALRSTEAMIDSAEKEYAYRILESQTDASVSQFTLDTDIAVTEFDAKNAAKKGNIKFSKSGNEVVATASCLEFDGYQGYYCSYDGTKATCVTEKPADCPTDAAQQG